MHALNDSHKAAIDRLANLGNNSLLPLFPPSPLVYHYYIYPTRHDPTQLPDTTLPNWPSLTQHHPTLETLYDDAQIKIARLQKMIDDLSSLNISPLSPHPISPNPSLLQLSDTATTPETLYDDAQIKIARLQKTIDDRDTERANGHQETQMHQRELTMSRLEVRNLQKVVEGMRHERELEAKRQVIN